MKKLLLLISLSICLYGCLSTEENLVINSDGSGTYTTAVDLSGMFDMMQMMASMDTSQNSELKKMSDKNIDSVISFKSFIDTVSSLSKDEKKLFEKATIQVKMNQEEKNFKLTMIYPFNKMDDLQKLIELQQSDKVPNPLKQSMGNEMAATGDNGLPSIGNIMNLTFKKGLIERKIDQQKLNDLKENEQFKEAGQVEEMLEAITFSSTFHLPKAAKNTRGEKLKLSDDKKTVTMNYNLLDLIKTPASLEFKVEY